jgi:hypothetical protein
MPDPARIAARDEATGSAPYPVGRPRNGVADQVTDALDVGLAGVVGAVLLPVVWLAIGVRSVVDRLSEPRDAGGH